MKDTPILQFGTSRFLQAHVDLMISEALEGGQAAGPITVVQSSGDASRSERLAALADPSGFPVRIRGLKDGQRIDVEKRVTSIRHAMSTATDWDALCDLFDDEVRYVVSNTGDTGFDPQASDTADRFDQSMSFPAKLRLLLRHRFRSGAAPITIMPAELISRNGDVLRDRVLEIAAGDAKPFRDWLAKDVIWTNSLVDRIVSAPIEPAGAIAEPYALWAIEAQQGLVPPCRHPDIDVVPSLADVSAKKLFLLNLPHTLMADRWLKEGRYADETVRDFLSHGAARDWLQDVMATEVLPAFENAGGNCYWQGCLERFDNPFLDHKLSDIAQNHSAKVDRRVRAFLNWSGRPCPTLAQAAQ